jgi:endonuclease/exonuclease/phosphatase family metal-dependent hydrolase
LPTLPVPIDQPLAEPSFPASNENPYLSFATFNIAKPSNRAVPRWTKRRLALGRTINDSKSDVIGVQEANNETVVGEGGKKMRTWEDIQALAKAGGYVGIKVEQDACGSACVHSAHILYKSTTVEQIDLPGNLPSGGQGALRNIADGLTFAKNREFSWAYLRGKNGTGAFLVINVHLNNQRSTTGKRDRAKVGAAVTKWAEALNKKSGMVGTPFVLLGDFNSYPRREPKGMPYQLKKQGWKDAYDIASDEYKFFDSAYTTSYTKGNRSGWPKKPITSRNPVRIDYIMYRGAGLRADLYVVALWLKKDGTFDNNYRASDHMMVQAFIYFDGAKATNQ